MSLNSEEVNILVYRYLEEAGFRHSAYAFSYESNIISSINVNISLPRGALVTLLQKAILFAEAEMFSLMTEGDLDTKFEKAVGSISLLDYALSEPQKIKALQKAADAPDEGLLRPSSISSSCSARAPSTSETNNGLTIALTPTSSFLHVETKTEPNNSVLSPTKIARTNEYPQMIEIRMDCDSNQTTDISDRRYPQDNSSGLAENTPQTLRDRDLRAQQTIKNGPLPRCVYRTTESIDSYSPQPSVSTGATIPDGTSENQSLHRNLINSADPFNKESSLLSTKMTVDNSRLLHPYNSMQNGFTAADCHTVQSSPSTSISSFPSLSHLHQQSYKSENAQFCGDHDPTDTRQQDPHYMVDTNVNGTAAAINHFVGKSIAEKEGTVTSSKSWT